MSIDEKTFYAVKCDRCGGGCNYDDHTHWDSVDSAREVASCSDWLVVGGRDVCDGCVTAAELEEDE